MVAPEDQQVLARRRVPTRQIIIHAAFAHVHAVERTRSGGSRRFGSLVRTYSSIYAFFCGVPPVTFAAHPPGRRAKGAHAICNRGIEPDVEDLALKTASRHRNAPREIARDAAVAQLSTERTNGGHSSLVSSQAGAVQPAATGVRRDGGSSVIRAMCRRKSPSAAGSSRVNRAHPHTCDLMTAAVVAVGVAAFLVASVALEWL
jgi:hypothetical protein